MKRGSLVEINCETDFVAKDANFSGFVKQVAELISRSNPKDLDELSRLALPDGQTVEAARQALVMKLGENISVRRFVMARAIGRLAYYLHGSKIGVLIDLEGGDEQLGKDLAMHIAASKPVCIEKSEVSPDLIAREREIYAAQAKESGKPDAIVAKMVDGRVAKFLAEVTLLGQSFVKDPDLTVEKLLQNRGAKIHAFYLYVVGEGIEKKKGDFVAEVMAQVGGA
jgi:elongation factor Ts